MTRNTESARVNTSTTPTGCRAASQSEGSGKHYPR
nr:MAG TPA: hypothetical protein [Caudoviricetes sp.]